MLSSCLLCPRGTQCRGYLLHEPMVKIHAALRQAPTGDAAIDAITHELTRQDMEILAAYGDKARVTCWSKGFVLALSHLLAHALAKPGLNDAGLAEEVVRVVDGMVHVVAHLPHDIRLDLPALEMEVHNHTVELMAKMHCKRMFPGRAFSEACRKGAAA